MSFRVAIGRCDCSNPPSALVAELCTKVRHTLEHLQSLASDQLAELGEETRDTWIAGRGAKIRVHRVPHEGATLIVVQGFVSTWRWPTYIGSDGVGHIVAEGFVFDREGSIHTAKDDLLWEFR